MESEKPAGLTLNVHLGALKAPWVAYCAARGLKPGAAIRDAIAHQLSASEANAPAAPLAKVRQQDEAPDEGGKERVRVWVSPSEKAAIKAFADAENCSVSRWIIEAVRTRLTGEPQFSTREIEVLGESNYQLMALGRNLNQIARRLNERKAAPELVATITELRAQIADHTAKVDGAMRASVERWRIG